MSNHAFNFDGGKLLSRMGATWFVSYLYFKEVDSSHKNWDLIENTTNRISAYNKSSTYHKFWLREVLNMDDSRMKTNNIYLSPSETKVMAQKVLTKWDSSIVGNITEV